MADAPQTITIDDWQRAAAASAAPRALLEALRQRIEESCPPGASIARAAKAVPNAQLAAIERRTASPADAAAWQRAMPLCGVPFAVNDSVDVVAIGRRTSLAAVARAPSAAATEARAR